MGKDYDERRSIKVGAFMYLVDDDDSTAWIKEGRTNGESTLALPESVELDGRVFTIKSVEIGAFSNEENLEELVIPDCYEYIDEDSFRSCVKLKTVHIGKGLEWYFKWSFCGSSLERVEIDPGNPFMKVSDDGRSVLSKDGKILMCNFNPGKRIEVQQGVEALSECAISCNDILEELVLPGTLKTLGPNSIFECHRLKRLVFLDGLEEAGNQSLSWNEELTEIDFPSTFRKFGYEAITDDNALTKMILRSPSVVDIEVEERFDTMGSYPLDTCILYVPSGLVDEYRNHHSWGRFRHIEPL